MANEVVYSGQGDTAAAEIMSQEFALLHKDRSVFGMHPALFYAGDTGNSRTLDVKVSYLGSMGYDLLGAGSEATAVSNTAWTDSSASVTVARKALKRAVSGLVRNSGADHGLFSDPVLLAQEALISREVTLRDMIAQLVGDFTDTVGTSGSDLTVDILLQGRHKVRENGVDGDLICVLHPQQWYDLQVDMKTETGLLNGQAARDLVEFGKPLGWQGRYLDMDIFVTDSVPTANSGADRAGGIFGRGCIVWADMSIKDHPLKQDGIINLGKVAVELDRDPASDLDNLVFTAYLGAVLGQDTGCAVITDA